MAQPRRRWDGDTPGSGVADGQAAALGLRQTLDEIGRPGWLTESPLVHLLPSLTGWVARNPERWRLIDAVDLDGCLVIRAEWLAEDRSPRDLRADAFGLLGSLVEGATYVEERVDSETVSFEVATGQHQGEMQAHGHLVSLRVMRQERDSGAAQITDEDSQ